MCQRGSLQPVMVQLGTRQPSTSADECPATRSAFRHRVSCPAFNAPKSCCTTCLPARHALSGHSCAHDERLLADQPFRLVVRRMPVKAKPSAAMSSTSRLPMAEQAHSFNKAGERSAQSSMC
ncbi:hypothetical protein CC85DRAFT_41610 [Cutaneotrichosporon oleaginosum]|uniref:Uncharacterized protein n=1 Tax=Cutaneotrichosporon oleaginosum TaxID=879819 RepID=A0A0J0XRI4_9TREE|nr:uncharacterized protein CC85DRAFT_41610 [Cutaneotrichosporon oleaginosum]KLT43677.1 hypothetical protein CC85DRAFT_41610 [Cutaneotrichosporon oleaginosum]